MALISSGINRVRAYALAAGVGADGKVINEPLSVLVHWQSDYKDKLFQVYVNGQLCGFTEALSQRQAVVSFGSSWQSPVRIEVFAVEPYQVINDYSNEFEFTGGNRVRLSWIRKAAVPAGSFVDIFSNGGSGQIDYQEPVKEGLPYWGVWQDKWGFGLCCFGAGGFGYDGNGAVGFGRGYFGDGELGFDSEELEWISSELQAGEYQFGIRIRDKDGFIDDEACETETVTVLPNAKGGEDISFGSYDANSNTLTLSINVSK